MNDSVGFYLRISYWYKYRATYILLKQTTTRNKVLSSPSNTVWPVVVASTVVCTICSSVIFKLSFVDAINWKFFYLFMLASLE